MNSGLKLEDAYRLGTAGSHRRFYAAHAPGYDKDFVELKRYIYHREVARRYVDQADVKDVPVADLGCGTGLIGEALAPQGLEVDGFDLSPDMLSMAQGKNVYRHLFEADLTAPTASSKGHYGALISSGTFTLGHLGPNALSTCLGLARRGALCIIGVNAHHFVESGFAAFFERSETAGRICRVSFHDVQIYEGVSTRESINCGQVATFRVC